MLAFLDGARIITAIWPAASFGYGPGDGLRNRVGGFKTVSQSSSNPDTKYPWQQAVLEALMEFRPDVLPQTINEAQRAISARLRDPTFADEEEQLAIRDALQSLRVLAGERTPKKQEESGLKKDIA